jgi:hypothetical protein
MVVADLGCDSWEAEGCTVAVRRAGCRHCAHTMVLLGCEGAACVRKHAGGDLCPKWIWFG